jgi:hypothetical protein
MTEWITKEIGCDQKCAVPPGMALAPVPKPRHAWGDIIVCPNCDAAFLIKKVSDIPELSAHAEKAGTK